MKDLQLRNKEFEELIENYGGIITKICYYFSSTAEEFKDLRQESLANIWNGLSKFRGDSGLSTWVYRVCLNSCVTYTRKNKRVAEKISIEKIADIPDKNGFDIAEYNEMHRLIGKLDSENKAIILLWLDEMSYEEISTITGLPKNTVAVRLKRIKEKLVKMSDS